MAGKGRSIWWTAHSWAGLKLSLFMSFILITGTLAVFAHEIDWLTHPAMRVAPSDAEPVSWGRVAQAAQAHVPDARLTAVYAPIDPWFAAEAWLSREDERPIRVFVDPYTGEVTGVGGWANAHRFLRQIHRHLMMPVKIGVPIVCTLALLLIVSLVTGLVTYKKWWRGFAKAPRPGDRRRFHGDLHRLLGLWSLWFVVVIAATGVWYMVESLGGAAPRSPQPDQRPPPAAVVVGAELDKMVSAAQRAYPELRIREIRQPDPKGGALAIMGQGRAILVRDRVNAVWLNPHDGEVLMVAKGEALGLHSRISEMADPLHFGTFGGLATKVIWFVAGVLLSALSVTGVIIYSLRLKKAAREAPRGSVAYAWRGMGLWAYPSVGLVLLGLALTPGALAGAG
jgi:uncharacterized iron-regulated membrane protein